MNGTKEKNRWSKIHGRRAIDIGVNSKGDLWVIGTNRVSRLGYDIYQYKNSDWKIIKGTAKKIAVGPSGPWVV